jgi:hypothetical protein
VIRNGPAVTTIPTMQKLKVKTGRPIKPKPNLLPKVLVSDTVGRTLDKCKVQFNLQEAMYYKQ